MKSLIRIATRKSPLAMWQANWVASTLQEQFPTVTIEYVKLSTVGDRFLNTPLVDMGGKALFLKELEEAILADEADIAVHSLKDVPSQLPDSLTISAFMPRAEPRDAFVSNKYASVEQLPIGAVVGTASCRRASQLLNLRPDLNIKSVRGNVQTRLAKLDADDYDALILAAVGLQRLQLQQRIRTLLDEKLCLPAVGQGVVCIESRVNDNRINRLLEKLNHSATEHCITAERTMNQLLGGSCHTPVAGYAKITGPQIQLKGLVASLDGSKIIKACAAGTTSAAAAIGEDLANKLLAQGASELIHAQ